jgi:4-amino-4-deoxy-L-arabinose transferase-like glycosyltransferase
MTGIRGLFQTETAVFLTEICMCGLLLFLVAAILFFAADYGSGVKWLFSPEKPGKKTTTLYSSKLEKFVFIFIILISIFFRAYKITDIPPACDRDEAKLCQDSIDIMENRVPIGGDSAMPIYIKTLTDNPALYNYFVSLFYGLSGYGDIQARIAGIIIGVLAVIAMYFLLRYLFSPGMAAAGGFLFAVMRWHVTLSRLIYHAGPAVLLFIFVLYFMYRAYKIGKTSDYVFLGLALGLSFYTYQATRIIPPALLLSCACAFIFNPDFRKKQRLKIVLSAVVFIVVTAPLLLYMFQHMDDFFSRSRSLYIFNKSNMAIFSADGLKNPLEIYLNSLSSVLLMFNKAGDINPMHNIPNMPILGFFAGIFAVMGFSCVALHIKSPFSAVTIFLFVCALHGSVFFRGAYHGIVSSGTPESTRVVLVIPIIIIFSAAYISRMNAFFIEQYGTNRQYLFSLLLAAILVLETYQSYELYFVQFPATKGYFSLLNGDKKQTANYLKSLGAGWFAIIDRKFYDNSVTDKDVSDFYFNIGGPLQAAFVTFDPEEKNQDHAFSSMNLVYILNPEEMPVLTELKKKHPNGIYKEFYSPFGSKLPSFFSFEVHRK